MIYTVLASLSAQPTSHEIQESSNCHQCRAYFQKTGPVCAHCKKQAALTEYSSFLLCYRRQNKRIIATSSTAVAQSPSKKAKTALKGKNTTKNNTNKNNIHVLGGRDDLFDTNEDVNFEVKKMDEGAVDGVLLMVLRQLKAHAGKSQHTNPHNDANDSETSDTPIVLFKDLCALEIKRQEQLKTEYHSMVSLWDRYSDLLKAYDELEQCKTRTSLNLSSVNTRNNNSSSKKSTSSGDNSGGTKAGDTETTAQLHPYELTTLVQSAYASALQSEHELQKCTNSLTFYKEQVKEIFTVHEEPDASLLPTNTTSDTNSSLIISEGTTLPTIKSSTTSKQPVVPSSPMKITVPTCLICQENLHTITAHTPSKHNHPANNNLTSTNTNPNTSTVLDTALEVVLLPCAHRFHRDCVTRWVRKHKKCPLCKAAATVAELVGVAQTVPLAADYIITGHSILPVQPVASVVNVKNVESTDKSTHHVSSTILPNIITSKVSSPASATNLSNNNRNRLKGKWGTKVDTLVCDLLELCEDQERLTEKAIVFSQWVEVRGFVMCFTFNASFYLFQSEHTLSL